MKYIFFLVAILSFAAQFAYSQGLGINTSGASPDASAIMDASSSLKGMLIPRMNTATVLSISSPAKGLLVYDTAKNQLMVNMGTPAIPNWQTIVYKSGWSLTGNSGIDTSINFIGTTDNHPLLFRINNFKAGSVDSISQNTGLGFRTLQSITSGNYNTALGYKALMTDSSGVLNTAIGADALRFNTTGNYNTALGVEALVFNKTGSSNIAIGSFSLNSLLSGSGNTAVGESSLYFDTSGSNNTANGYEALLWNNYGNDNTAIGSQTLRLNGQGATQYYEGINNTGVGSLALNANTNGYNNTANGGQSLLHNSSGYNNAAFGLQSLLTNTTGIGNTAVGTAADVNSASLQNATALGYFASATASNQVRIGNGSVTSIGGYANWTNISDGRIKTNIKEDVPGLSFISKLTPVTYQLDLEAADKIIKNPFISLKNGTAVINPGTADQTNSRREKEQIVYTGFIAQDVETVAKSINYKFSGIDVPKNDRDLYGLRYADFVAPLVKAVQELNKKSEEQEKQMEIFKKEIAELKNLLLQTSKPNQ